MSETILARQKHIEDLRLDLWRSIYYRRYCSPSTLLVLYTIFHCSHCLVSPHSRYSAYSPVHKVPSGYPRTSTSQYRMYPPTTGKFTNSQALHY
ncbi:unnamed protein product [Schistosoma curassoni]|nr:unnamed protein product [Schistosoma curassoni]